MDVLPVAASPYNYIPQVTRHFHLAQQIILSDISTIEGAGASDSSLGIEARMSLIRRLAEIGVTQIQCGWPGESAVDREVVSRVRKESIPVSIEGTISLAGADWREQIDTAIDARVDVLGLQYPISDIGLMYLQKTDRAQMLHLSVDAVRYARGRGPTVKFSGTDTLRADLSFVREVFEGVLDAGAHWIAIVDDAGSAMPAAVRYFVGQVVDSFAVPVQVHFHNDFGLALANTLAAASAGAQLLDVSINGSGERAGHASLDEVVVALQVFHGADLGIRMQDLKPLSDFFARLTGVPIHPSKALSGDGVFAFTLDQRLQGMLDSPVVWETIPPEAVGNHRWPIIGGRISRSALGRWLSSIGLAATPAEMELIGRQLETLAVRNGAIPTDEELAAIASALCRQQ